MIRVGPPYSAKAIANFFLEKSPDLRNMKLQKLVYFAHGWHLALYNEPLINERVEAWKWGPVVPSLYRAFKEWGSGPVRALAHEGSWDPSTGRLNTFVPRISPFDERTKGFLNRIWDVYGEYSDIQLSNLSHEPGGPWHATDSDVRGNDISDDLIGKYFRGKRQHVG